MRRHLKVIAVLAAFVVLGAACGDDDDDTASGSDSGTTVPEGPAISIGAQDFGESQIVAQIYQGALENAGYDVSVQDLTGFRELVFDGFESGDINLAPDYVASQLEFLLADAGEEGGQATSDVDETLAKLTPLLEDRDLVALTPSDAVDTNAFVVTQQTSDDKDITTLSDLAANGSDLTLGAPPDCETNGFCIPGLMRVYGVDFTSHFSPLEFGLIPDALDAGEVQIGVVGSTDGRLADESTGWVLLEDDKGMFAADNVFPVASQELVDAYGDDFKDLMDSISAQLTTDDLVAMNKRYDIDHDDAEDIAADWLSDNGFD
ncbi:MAG TPA: ABC transporter substrate-binding protein [Acidimicrobiales bacterium]|nr:ABC transporter substrate-binding protein [Acidimicrobiales bacterium]